MRMWIWQAWYSTLIMVSSNMTIPPGSLEKLVCFGAAMIDEHFEEFIGPMDSSQKACLLNGMLAFYARGVNEMFVPDGEDFMDYLSGRLEVRKVLDYKNWKIDCEHDG